jgi:hypothetical protein
VVKALDVSGDVWQAVAAGPGGELVALVSPNTNDFGAGCSSPRLITESPGSNTVDVVGSLPVSVGRTYSCEQLGTREQLATFGCTIYALAGDRLWAIRP